MNYAYIIFGLVFLSAAAIGGYNAGKNHIQIEFDKYKQAQNDAFISANKEALKKQNELQARSDKVAESAAISIKAVRDYYANHPTIVYRSSGLRLDATGSGIQLSKSAATASGVNDPAIDAGHFTQTIEPDLVARCADTTVRLLGLQQWAKQISQ